MQYPDHKYWTNRYINNETGWDIGGISTPLMTYMEQYTDKSITILLPGCGNAYEAIHLWRSGLINVHILDISAVPLKNFIHHYPDFPAEQVHHEDFFAHKGSYDVILEQTFFCALDPQLRPAYVEKMHELLKPGGRLAGVLFDFPLEDGPPFGGSKREYEQLFKSYFKLNKLERCTNSIKPRQGKELFIEVEKDKA